MEQKMSIKKFTINDEELKNCTKEELIYKIKALNAHNFQLKNILGNISSGQNKEIKENKPFDFSKYNFRHVTIKLFYLGWDYKGFVTQEDTTDTVEYHLFQALLKTKLIKDRASSNYHRCGRTDKGVSAFGQVISLDIRSNLKETDNDISKEIHYCKILNRVLPNNIQCLAWSPVESSFSARFNCKSRTYKYYFPKGNLDIEKMKEASEKLLGVHDFRNLCKMDVGNGITEFIRNIFEISIHPLSEDNREYSIYVIKIKAKAFLWHQIRCIMGILLLIGQNQEEPRVIEELLNIEKNPRKPEYSMASEIPLNLFFCEYNDLNWHYDKDSLEKVAQKLNMIWTMYAVKEAMVKDMLSHVHDFLDGFENRLTEHLLPNLKTRNYIPLMKRQTCDSLEDKIKHFTKRKRIEIKHK